MFNETKKKKETLSGGINQAENCYAKATFVY